MFAWSTFRGFIAALLLTGSAAVAYAAFSAEPAIAAGVPVVIASDQLPAEARQTLALIKHGGSYPFHKDGAIFGNFEHALPKQARGYYHEYTVPTPGARNRGGRRIVVGDAQPLPEYFFTGDHYRTFLRIQE